MSSDYPEPMYRIQKMLEQYGGWSKLFRMSAETYDQKYIIHRDNEQGFWGEFARIRCDEQFMEEVKTCTIEFRSIYPEDERNKDELNKDMAKALLAEGWKPVKSRILKEIADLKRKRKGEISWLKNEQTRRMRRNRKARERQAARKTRA